MLNIVTILSNITQVATHANSRHTQHWSYDRMYQGPKTSLLLRESAHLMTKTITGKQFSRRFHAWSSIGNIINFPIGQSRVQRNRSLYIFHNDDGILTTVVLMISVMKTAWVVLWVCDILTVVVNHQTIQILPLHNLLVTVPVSRTTFVELGSLS